MKWWHVVLVLLLGAGGFLLWTSVSSPPPGEKKEDQGREHVTPQAVDEFPYNSNPPTSGPHLPAWVKPGVFTEPKHDGELIHSLEHGYVIISYNCGVHLGQNPKSKAPASTDASLGRQNPKQILNSNIKKAFVLRVSAHEEEEGSPSGDLNLPEEATGSAITENEACKTLLNQLKEFAESKRLWKLIVVPRPNLDTTIALTAWAYIDAFDEFDSKRIERFIDYHRDHGPEKTME